MPQRLLRRGQARLHRKPVIKCKQGPHRNCRWGPRSLSEKSQYLSDRLQKCRYFCAAQRRKSPCFARRNPCTARLPGHSIPFEAGGCPLELPPPRLKQNLFHTSFSICCWDPAGKTGGVPCFMVGSWTGNREWSRRPERPPPGSAPPPPGPQRSRFSSAPPAAPPGR